MDANQSVWEQELYGEIDYMKKQSLFHCFEGDTAFVGLSFMDEIEANHFNEKVQERIRKRKERAASYLSADCTGTVTPSVPGTISGQPTRPARTRKDSKKKKDKGRQSGSSWRPWKSKDKSEDKPRLNKLMIGAPETASFIHLQGVKPGGEGGFEKVDNLHTIDPRMKQIMEIAGLDEKILSNPKKAAKVAKQMEKLAEESGRNLYDMADEQIRQNTIKRPTKKPLPPKPMQPPKPPQAPTCILLKNFDTISKKVSSKQKGSNDDEAI